MVPILINNDVSEPSHNDLKFMVQNDNYFFTNLIHPISWDNYIGKEFSRKSVTEPISVQQGLAQHCKPTICQFKQRACLCDLPAFPWPYLPPLHLLLCRPVYRGRFAIWPPSHLRALHVLFPMSGRFSPETCCLSLTTTSSVGLGSNVTTHRLSLAILLKINTFYLVCTRVHTHTHTQSWSTFTWYLLIFYVLHFLSPFHTPLHIPSRRTAALSLLFPAVFSKVGTQMVTFETVSTHVASMSKMTNYMLLGQVP